MKATLARALREALLSQLLEWVVRLEVREPRRRERALALLGYLNEVHHDDLSEMQQANARRVARGRKPYPIPGDTDAQD